MIFLHLIQEKYYYKLKLTLRVHIFNNYCITFLGIKENVSKSIKKKLECSPGIIASLFLRRIPILSWLPKYSPRNDLVGDILSGFTVAIMHIPQGK